MLTEIFKLSSVHLPTSLVSCSWLVRWHSMNSVLTFGFSYIRPNQIHNVEDLLDFYSILRISSKSCVDWLRDKCINQFRPFLPYTLLARIEGPQRDQPFLCLPPSCWIWSRESTSPYFFLLPIYIRDNQTLISWRTQRYRHPSEFPSSCIRQRLEDQTSIFITGNKKVCYGISCIMDRSIRELLYQYL